MLPWFLGRGPEETSLYLGILESGTSPSIANIAAHDTLQSNRPRDRTTTVDHLFGAVGSLIRTPLIVVRNSVVARSLHQPQTFTFLRLRS